MARWNEDQERWQGYGDRYGDDERRFRAERGEQGSWRAHDWRDDEDRFREYRGGERYGERGGEWRDRERWMREREPGRDWERDPARADFGREYRPEVGGRFGDRGGWRGRDFGGEERGAYGYGGRERWPARGYGAGDWRGEYMTYGSGAYPERGYGREREDWRYRGEGWQYGPEREAGPFERLRERFRKLTGRGPKGYRRPDERVRDEVCERIARSGVNAMDVEVEVENGEVTLSGYAESREDKRRLEDIAEEVFGVDEVHNHVRIRRGEQMGTTSMTAGTGTTGTGAAMSAQQAGTRVPSQQGQFPSERH